MIREELQKGQLRGLAGSRAWVFERRLLIGCGNEWAKRCLEELKKREREEKDQNGRINEGNVLQREISVQGS